MSDTVSTHRFRIVDEAYSEDGLRALGVLIAAPRNGDAQRGRCVRRDCPGRGVFLVRHRGGVVWLCRSCARALVAAKARARTRAEDYFPAPEHYGIAPDHPRWFTEYLAEREKELAS